MNYKQEIESSYQRIIQPLENYSGKPSNTISGMVEYMKVFGEVFNDFAVTMNEHHAKAVNLYPEKQKEIEDLIHEKKNQLVSTYKPQ